MFAGFFYDKGMRADTSPDGKRVTEKFNFICKITKEIRIFFLVLFKYQENNLI